MKNKLIILTCAAILSALAIAIAARINSKIKNSADRPASELNKVYAEAETAWAKHKYTDLSNLTEIERHISRSLSGVKPQLDDRLAEGIRRHLMIFIRSQSATDFESYWSVIGESKPLATAGSIYGKKNAQMEWSFFQEKKILLLLKIPRIGKLLLLMKSSCAIIKLISNKYLKQKDLAKK